MVFSRKVTVLAAERELGAATVRQLAAFYPGIAVTPEEDGFLLVSVSHDAAALGAIWLACLVNEAGAQREGTARARILMALVE